VRVEAAELLLRRLDIAPAQASRLLDLPAERVIEALSTPARTCRCDSCPVVDGTDAAGRPVQSGLTALGHGPDPHRVERVRRHSVRQPGRPVLDVGAV
jgi:hypothetical protein